MEPQLNLIKNVSAKIEKRVFPRFPFSYLTFKGAHCAEGKVFEVVDISLTGMTMEVEKNMSASPRRIASLPVTIHLPKNLTEESKSKLEAAALACPVHKSLHEAIDAKISFLYDV